VGLALPPQKKKIISAHMCAYKTTLLSFGHVLSPIASGLKSWNRPSPHQIYLYKSLWVIHLIHGVRFVLSFCVHIGINCGGITQLHWCNRSLFCLVLPTSYGSAQNQWPEIRCPSLMLPFSIPPPKPCCGPILYWSLSSGQKRFLDWSSVVGVPFKTKFSKDFLF
jgi:hypothetical protein